MTQNGKGDKPRPRKISKKQWDANWGLIFRDKNINAESESSEAENVKSKGFESK